jgi:hypothetical protein
MFRFDAREEFLGHGAEEDELPRHGLGGLIVGEAVAGDLVEVREGEGVEVLRKLSKFLVLPLCLS